MSLIQARYNILFQFYFIFCSIRKLNQIGNGKNLSNRDSNDKMGQRNSITYLGGFEIIENVRFETKISNISQIDRGRIEKIATIIIFE